MNSLKILSIITLIALPIYAYYDYYPCNYDYYPCDNDACFLLLENTIDDLLSRIENDEETIAQILTQQKVNTQAINNLLSRIGVDEGTIAQILTLQKSNTQAINNLLSRIGSDEQTITELLTNQEATVFLERLQTALQNLIQMDWLQMNLNNPNLANIDDKFKALLTSSDLETWSGADGGLWGYNASGTLFHITNDLVRIDF